MGLAIISFFVRADSDWKYTSPESWRDISIGVIDGYTFSHPEFDHYLAEQKKLRNKNVIFISGEQSYQRLLQLLLNKRVDAILDDKAFIQYEIGRLYGKENLISVPKVISVGRTARSCLQPKAYRNCSLIDGDY